MRITPRYLHLKTAALKVDRKNIILIELYVLIFRSKIYLILCIRALIVFRNYGGKIAKIIQIRKKYTKMSKNK